MVPTGFDSFSEDETAAKSLRTLDRGPENDLNVDLTNMSQMDTESSLLESGDATVASTCNCIYTHATLDAANESDVRGAAAIERGVQW